MNLIPDFLSLLTTLLVLGLIVAGVMKIFQINTNLEEMKELLKDIRRGSDGVAAAHPAAYTSAQYAPPPPAQPYVAQPYAAQPYSPSAAVRALAAAVPAAEPAPPPVVAATSPAPPSDRLAAEPRPVEPLAVGPLAVGPGMNFSRPPTPEELVRAIHAQDFKGDEFPL